MIVEWFLALCTGVLGWLADTFGEWEPPAELVNAAQAANGVIQNFAGLAVWVDWIVLGACVAAALATWALVVGIKLVRALIAHVPKIGGAGD